jgi:hypothetical protein
MRQASLLEFYHVDAGDLHAKSTVRHVGKD